jgi:hypothetical protein
LLFGGVPLLATHSPAEGRAGFYFSILLTLGGASALAAARVGPQSRWWPRMLVVPLICAICLALLLVWMLLVLLSGSSAYNS